MKGEQSEMQEQYNKMRETERLLNNAINLAVEHHAALIGSLNQQKKSIEMDMNNLLMKAAREDIELEK